MNHCGMLLTIFFLFFASTTSAEYTMEDKESEKAEYLFYRGLEYGSESQFNPISSFINYSLDTLQVPKSFDQKDFSGRLEETWDNLRDPIRAINREGKFRDFVNRQIFPVDFNNLDDSLEMIPNYALHLFGGGMLYRKNVEWFESRGYPYPRASAALLGMAAEFLQEVLEKKSTPSDDEVADFYLFRPAGMLLFNWDPVARFAAHTLRMVEWPYQPLYNPANGKFMNVGNNFAVRPDLFRSDRHCPFLFFGLTTMMGLSHRIHTSDHISWGFGAAVEKAERDDIQLRASGGLFYDRNDSLLGSLIINGTDDLAVRLNVYPGVIFPGRWSPGVFLGIGNRGDVVAGLTFKVLPLGIGAGP